MTDTFKDYFSDKSELYGRFRPSYPRELFEYLASISQQHELAWDCATGNGQSAVELADFFQQVIATDASKSQLANAVRKNGISYRNETAEKSTLISNSVDLITVAQAIHWFDFDGFAAEAKRVLKPDGLLAAWTYGLHRVTPGIDKLIDHLYRITLDGYWPPERTLIDEQYLTLRLPMTEHLNKEFDMDAEWTLAQLTGYLRTWSAVKRYHEDKGVNPVDQVELELRQLWGDVNATRIVRWPLLLRLWKP